MNFDKIKRFAQLQKKLELAEYLDVGDFGPTYFSDKYPDLLIKKFKGRDKISLLESWVNLYNEFSIFIQSINELDEMIEIYELIHFGEDFMIRQFYNLGAPLREVSPLTDDFKKIETLSKDLRRILSRKCRTPKQKLFKEILFSSLQENGGIFWDSINNKIVITDLSISPKVLNDFSKLYSEYKNAVNIGSNLIVIGHRPKIKDFEILKEEGFTHIVTLLSEKEGAKKIGNQTVQHEIEWLWLPMSSAKVPIAKDENLAIASFLDNLSDIFSENVNLKIYIHCSAGIHRTGMITLAFLIKLGFSPNKSLDYLKQLRPHTYDNVGENRIKWANDIDSIRLP